MTVYVYFAAHKSKEELLSERLEKHTLHVRDRIVIGEALVLAIYARNMRVVMEFEQWLDEEAMAYNITYHNDDVSYWPASVLAMRYDFAGNAVAQTSATSEPEGVREVLHQLIQLKDNDPRQKDRMFHAYLINVGFEDQEKNGKLHIMRKLVGGI